MSVIGQLLTTVGGDRQADRVVPPTGFTAHLTTFTAAAMAFLAVFAIALALAAGRLADRWSDELAQTATLRISAPSGQLAEQTEAALNILATTPGVAAARPLDEAEQRALLTPWFGPGLPVESLPLPQLIEIVETAEGFDAEGLRLRLRADVPGGVLDDHTRWRRPLVEAAGRLRLLAGVSVGLIALATAAMVTLAARAALAANSQVIGVLRLVGARDAYIARAFVRRFTLRALGGSLAGIAPALGAVALLPQPDPAGGFLTGLGFVGSNWLLPFAVPPFAAVIAFWATRTAAMRALRNKT